MLCSQQFGNITLWSVIWPLAPVMGFINNWFELRSDALKICVNARRPVPKRSETIGPWLDVLGALARLAAFTNAALLYLFQEKEVCPVAGSCHATTVMRSYLHPSVPSGLKIGTEPTRVAIGTMLPAFLPRSGTAGALAASLLFALICEQAYGVIVQITRHVLERILWRSSPEETKVRRKQWDNRVSLVEQLQQASIAGRRSNQTPTLLTRDRVHPDYSFWDPTHDTGLNMILSGAKSE